MKAPFSTIAVGWTKAFTGRSSFCPGESAAPFPAKGTSRPLVEGLLGCIQDLQNLEPFPAVGHRGFARFDAPEKLKALELQGFRLVEGDALRLRFRGHGDLVPPPDLVGIEHQLVRPGLRVVENSHLPVPHDDELLLLERVEPGNEDVGPKPRGKMKVGHGHVGDLLVEVIPPGGGNAFRLLSGQSENHGDVMGGERPQGVLLPPDLPQVEPVRIDVIHPSQLAGFHEFFQTDESGVILKKVPHHEDPAARRRQVDEFQGFLLTEDQGFFHEGVFPRQQDLADHRVMRFRRRRHNGGGNVFSGKDVAHRQDPFDAGKSRFHLRQDGLILVADEAKGAQFMKIPDQVPSPVSRSDDGDT